MKVTSATKKSEVRKNWVHMDAEGKVLGRLASEVAHILMGKHKPNYVPYLDSGDIVMITNTKKIVVTGKKETDKIYYRHSGQVGNLKTHTVEKLRAINPNRIIYMAVRGMLPKNRLQSVRMANLKLFADENHPHQAQIAKKADSAVVNKETK